jgi:hypothetical protein
MVDRDHPHYIETRERLKGHWGLDLLDLRTEEDLARMCDVENQLLPSKRPALLEPTLI